MRWLLFLICALLPIYQIRFQIFGLPTTLLEVMILVLFFWWLIKKIKTKEIGFFKLDKNWKFFIIAWLFIGIIAVFSSPQFWPAFGHWRAYFLEPILFLIIFLDLNITNQIQSNLIIFALSLSALYISFWAIGQKIFGGGMLSLESWQYPLSPVWRATGPFPQSNFLGLYLGPIVILSVGRLIKFLRIKKLFLIIYYLLVIILSVIAIIFARSEGAVIGILVGLIFLLFFLLKRRWFFLFLLLVIISFSLVISPWRNYLLQKLKFQDLSGQLRLNIWQGAIELIKNRPIFGAGLRGYQKLIPYYQKPFSLPTGEIISTETHPYPHNLFLAIWTELGIFGLIVFLFILFQFFKSGLQKLKIENLKTIKNNNLLIISILSAMVTILIHGLVDTPYFKNDLSVLFWLIVGLMMVDEKLSGDNLS